VIVSGTERVIEGENETFVFTVEGLVEVEVIDVPVLTIIALARVV
jgi:hypothetical protein